MEKSNWYEVILAWANIVQGWRDKNKCLSNFEEYMDEHPISAIGIAVIVSLADLYVFSVIVGFVIS